MKNNRGFTLIELMIAIAIIGILALVLIPRVAGLKDSAREQGLDTNVRNALAIAEGMVDNYGADDILTFEQDLATKLENSEMKNPVTKATTVANAEPTDGDCAFAYVNDADAATEADDALDGSAPDFAGGTNYLGVVYYDAFVENGKLKVRFIPCSVENGAIIANKDQTTN